MQRKVYRVVKRSNKLINTLNKIVLMDYYKIKIENQLPSHHKKALNNYRKKLKEAHEQLIQDLI